jgi:hypothetical protein
MLASQGLRVEARLAPAQQGDTRPRRTAPRVGGSTPAMTLAQRRLARTVGPRRSRALPGSIVRSIPRRASMVRGSDLRPRTTSATRRLRFISRALMIR